MHLVVIYDAEQQLAAVVDTDAWLGYGPVVPSAPGRDLLQAWVDSLPFDLEGASSEFARGLFAQFAERQGLLADTPAESAQEPPDPAAVLAGGPEVALADREAQSAGDPPPPPQPADTDPTAQAGPTPAAPSVGTPSAPDADASGSAPAQPLTPSAPSEPTPTSEQPPVVVTKKVPCANCNGQGVIATDVDGQAVEQTCPLCQGIRTIDVPA